METANIQKGRGDAGVRALADWPFGAYDRMPVQPWIAALFIANTAT